MSRRVWYLLAGKGSEGHLSKMKGEVECFGDPSIYQLKKLVLQENKVTLGHTDALNLEVWTYNGKECSADDDLSKHQGFGVKSKPFIIYYPPGMSWNHLIPSLLCLCLPCTTFSAQALAGCPHEHKILGPKSARVVDGCMHVLLYMYMCPEQMHS